MTTLDHPLLLSSILVPKPWGGDRLRTLRDAPAPDGPLGEAWDVADLPQSATPVVDPVSRVVGGPLDGCSLHEVLARCPDELLGAAARSVEGRFPLLVKLLDAGEHLSIQVHPPRTLDPARAKTESWVVLDAVDGAELLLGVRDGVTLDDVRTATGTPALLDLVAWVPARAGDVIHVPAGTIHALGAGVLVAEVQTPSDVTHRLWDWPDDRDGGRELHVEAGLRSIEAGWEHNLDVTPAAATAGELVVTDAYRLQRCVLDVGEPVPRAAGGSRVTVVTVLAGELRWDGPDGTAALARGGTVVLPAACTTAPVATSERTTVLLAHPA